MSFLAIRIAMPRLTSLAPLNRRTHLITDYLNITTQLGGEETGFARADCCQLRRILCKLSMNIASASFTLGDGRIYYTTVHKGCSKVHLYFRALRQYSEFGQFDAAV